MSQQDSLQILALATDDSVVEFVKSVVSKAEVTLVSTEDDFDEAYEEFEDGKFAVIICGSALEQSFATEAAQVLNCQCPMTPSFYITQQKDNFSAKDMIKNGFNKAFLYPADKDLLKSNLLDSVSADALGERHFKPVRIVDLEPGEHLGFATHVFLPLNKKHVQFSSAEEPFTEKKAQKLQKHHVGSIHIDHKDSKAFYEYTAKRLKKLGQDGSMSATEREEKLRESVSGLFSQIFDISQKDTFDSGKSLMSSCQKIVSNYITGGMNDNWYANLVRSIGSEQGSYNHASEVSTFAALFAIALQYPSPEDLALAGFIHDISLVEFPAELRKIPQNEWPEEIKKSYENHPLESLNAVKKKKMIVNETVEKAILGHHEKFNGTGFPKQKAGDMIPEAAQILSFADQFQRLMTLEEGQKRLSPIEAFKKIEKTGSINPAMLRKIKPMLSSGSEE